MSYNLVYCQYRPPCVSDSGLDTFNTPDLPIENVVSCGRNRITGRWGLHRHPKLNPPPHEHVSEILVRSCEDRQGVSPHELL